MRQHTYFEAYLDDMTTIHVFLSKHSYDGLSNKFYLRDHDGNIQELEIQSIEQTSQNYNTYTLTIPQPLEIGVEYYVVHQHARETILEYAGITKCEDFDTMFYYDGKDLGVTYTKERSSFAVWAPTASKMKLEIQHGSTIKTYEMKRTLHGVFRYTINEDIENASYVYIVRVNGEWKETIDPYAMASTSNSTRSIVIDISKITIKDYPLPALQSYCDAILYEASIRDFTMQKGIGVENPGKFLGFIEESEEMKRKKIGFSYLTSLGITHVQLMPVMDFGSVDEMYPHIFYNWGYDPVQWQCLEGSLASDASQPYTRIFEFCKVVEQCHKNGLRVTLDVVFNHVYDLAKSALQILVPNYYFQMNIHGDYSNGTYCGNDIDSKRKMCSKLIIDTCECICKTYKIDGFRFDLMGILDIDTMNEIYQSCRQINPNIMLYGEGWDMPSFLEQSSRATIANSSTMPNIAHFSDRFRDVVKGNTSEHEVYVKGFCTGSSDMFHAMKNVLLASCMDESYGIVFQHPKNVVNYVECHDNMTCWDKIKECCQDETRETRILRHKMCIAAVLLAQGIPFLHSGQEFARTKYGKHNTYQDVDEINKIDYDRRDTHHDIVECTKTLIKIRKQYPCLRNATMEEVTKHVQIMDIEKKVLIYHVFDKEDDLMIFFNPTNERFTYHLDSQYKLLYYNCEIENQFYQELQIDHYSTIIMRKC